MIRLLGFGISQRAAHRVRLELHIGVGKQQPVTRRLLVAVHMACVFPSQPAGSSDDESLANGHRESDVTHVFP